MKLWEILIFIKDNIYLRRYCMNGTWYLIHYHHKQSQKQFNRPLPREICGLLSQISQGSSSFKGWCWNSIGLNFLHYEGTSSFLPDHPLRVHRHARSSSYPASFACAFPARTVSWQQCYALLHFHTPYCEKSIPHRNVKQFITWRILPQLKPPASCFNDQSCPVRYCKIFACVYSKVTACNQKCKWMWSAQSGYIFIL